MKRYYIKISEMGIAWKLVYGFDTKDEACKWYEDNLPGPSSIQGCMVSLVDMSDGMYRDFETDKNLYYN